MARTLVLCLLAVLPIEALLLAGGSTIIMGYGAISWVASFAVKIALTACPNVVLRRSKVPTGSQAFVYGIYFGLVSAGCELGVAAAIFMHSGSAYCIADVFVFSVAASSTEIGYL